MNKRVEKTQEHLSGVKCVVSNCYYNSKEDTCLAQKIEIQPSIAKNSEETDCATFIKS
ncbi:MAG: DUF1540 domain-containing protein [Caldicoprobacterales bacterium]|jgi:hypothetical protein